MARHMSRPVLRRLFSGAALQAEADALLPHLGVCNRCRSRAIEVVAELRRDRALIRVDAERHAYVSLIEEEESEAIELLRARGWWSDLRELEPSEQMERVRSRRTLQTLAIFEAMLEEVKGLLAHDPYRAEQQALAAEAVAQVLPSTRFSLQFKNDRQAEALVVVANCRRLAADWTGSLRSLAVAKSRLKSGTGDTLLLARLLSVHASLACDTGKTETALELLNQAREVLREEGEVEELGSCLVQLAGTLMADHRFDEAMAHARDSLGLVAESSRREMLARAIVVESLLELDRPFEALHAYWAHQELFKEQAAKGASLQISYLEARLLDGLDCVRESDKLFRKVIEGYAEAELYKESFRVSLTLFESYFRRSRLDKAAKLCQDSISMLRQCGGHKQMVAAWEELLQLIVNQGLERRHLVEARQYLARHWHQPASSPPFSGADPGSAEPNEARPEQEPSPFDLIDSEEEATEPRRSDLPPGGLWRALELHEREYISIAFSKAGGRIREASELLGMSRNSLRSKLKKLGIVAGQDEPE